MADVRPFRPLRFAALEQLASLVAPPYDVIDAELRAELGSRSEHNIVHIDLPAGEGDAKYEHANALLAAWTEAGILTRDDKPVMIRYEQVFTSPSDGRSFTRRGVFGVVRAEPYETRSVLPHERTLSGPKVDREKLSTATQASLSPIFLLYADPSKKAKAVLDETESGHEFTTPDGIVHRVAIIDDASALSSLCGAIQSKPLLIADGHHRYETAVKLRKTINEANESASEDAAHNFVMAFFSDQDDDGLLVLPTHRLVHDLPGFDRDKLREHAKRSFDLKSIETNDDAKLFEALSEAGKNGPSFALVYPDGEGDLLTLHDHPSAHPSLAAEPAELRGMDVVVLHTALIQDGLGITKEMQAKKTNIHYFKSGDKALKAIRAGEGDVLFVMNATSAAEVRISCEAGHVMPQKSTYFYPKVLTGLAIHSIAEGESIAKA